MIATVSLRAGDERLELLTKKRSIERHEILYATNFLLGQFFEINAAIADTPLYQLFQITIHERISLGGIALALRQQALGSTLVEAKVGWGGGGGRLFPLCTRGPKT